MNWTELGWKRGRGGFVNRWNDGRRKYNDEEIHLVVNVCRPITFKTFTFLFSFQFLGCLCWIDNDTCTLMFACDTHEQIVCKHCLLLYSFVDCQKIVWKLWVSFLEHISFFAHFIVFKMYIFRHTLGLNSPEITNIITVDRQWVSVFIH